MTLEQLKDKKKKLEEQREQLVAQFHQITGAIAIIDEQLKEAESENTEEIKYKKAA